MKLINKFLIGSLCLGLLTFVSCSKDDDGPSEPAYQGTFTGDLTVISSGEAKPYSATSITATHDTSGFSFGPSVKIEVVNSSGVKIIIHLADTTAQLTPYFLRRSGINESTINLTANSDSYTTRTDDIPGDDNGLITITDGGSKDGILRGNIILLKWFKVKTGQTPDSLVALMQNGSFEVPLTRKGYTFEPGDASLSAKINGTAFNSTTVFSSGFSLTATNASLQSLTVNLPDDATVGEHNINASSEYQVIYMSGGTPYSSEGTMNITAFDANAGTATGTFQFTGTSGATSVSVTEGAFTF